MNFLFFPLLRSFCLRLENWFLISYVYFCVDNSSPLGRAKGDEERTKDIMKNTQIRSDNKKENKKNTTVSLTLVIHFHQSSYLSKLFKISPFFSLCFEILSNPQDFLVSLFLISPPPTSFPSPSLALTHLVSLKLYLLLSPLLLLPHSPHIPFPYLSSSPPLTSFPSPGPYPPRKPCTFTLPFSLGPGDAAHATRYR